jgi:4-hydroxythreonine-4-phosphate dehydrogenase
MRQCPPLALSMGEPAGIGGEIALKAWLGRARDVPLFFAIDDPDRLRKLAIHLGFQVNIETIKSPAEAPGCFHRAFPVFPVEHPVDCQPGKPDPKNAKAVISAIEQAVAFVKTGDAAALVTNPIHKAVLAKAGFKHPGHTEFLGELAGVDEQVMMLTADDLRVVPLTVHVPIKDVPGLLTDAAIVRQGRILAAALKRYFAISTPRIAVAGLNPHAGEEGVLGDEEARIIAPAIRILRQEGIDAFGPLPADTLFHADARKRYDAVLCMYHDQALIPVKMLNFFAGVNVTLGLPFIRTSPDHGTALSLAGTGQADPGSLIAALRLARRMADADAAAA